MSLKRKGIYGESQAVDLTSEQIISGCKRFKNSTLKVIEGDYDSTFTQDTLSSDITLTLPATTGTLALTTDNPSYAESIATAQAWQDTGGGEFGDGGDFKSDFNFVRIGKNVTMTWTASGIGDTQSSAGRCILSGVVPATMRPAATVNTLSVLIDDDGVYAQGNGDVDSSGNFQVSLSPYNDWASNAQAQVWGGSFSWNIA